MVYFHGFIGLKIIEPLYTTDISKCQLFVNKPFADMTCKDLNDEFDKTHRVDRVDSLVYCIVNTAADPDNTALLK